MGLILPMCRSTKGYTSDPKPTACISGVANKKVLRGSREILVKTFPRGGNWLKIVYNALRSTFIMSSFGLPNLVQVYKHVSSLKESLVMLM